MFPCPVQSEVRCEFLVQKCTTDLNGGVDILQICVTRIWRNRWQPKKR